MYNEYIVYIKINGSGCITDINSSAFITDNSGWIEIDRGEGDRYHHAQGNYLDKPITDDHGRHNYRYSNGIIEEIPENEKPPVPEFEEPIPQEEINLDFDFRLACLELGL